ncbi:energy transducer TonB [Burkholderia sp. JKS000303]|uniref:energy transducer TonB n=1 Tax=Burkholderia sp. JKS000303 TaxID=1938747 RepID=UPI000BF53740|nr:energy transducer TonB [Burkholderia sp. JKS000303]PFH20206.1 outer membrane transport energization protein TonB [Burkholderia sp. JKS000303]
MNVPISSDAVRRSDRRRLVALAYGIAPAGPHAATIAMPSAARSRESSKVVALTVLVVHSALIVVLWHAAASDTRSTLPRALAVEVEASEAMKTGPDVQRRANVVTSAPPARAHASRDAAVHRDVRPSLPAPRLTGHARPAQSPATAVERPDGDVARTTPAPKAAATTAAIASADTVPAAPAPAVQPAPPAAEPVTAPRFAAAYLHNPAPDYPDVAQRRGWEGTTFLNVHVLANGRPDRVVLAASSGHDAFDDAAVAAVTDWRFVPAKRGAQAIDGWVRVPVVFKLEN